MPPNRASSDRDSIISSSSMETSSIRTCSTNPPYAPRSQKPLPDIPGSPAFSSPPPPIYSQLPPPPLYTRPPPTQPVNDYGNNAFQPPPLPPPSRTEAPPAIERRRETPPSTVALPLMQNRAPKSRTRSGRSSSRYRSHPQCFLRRRTLIMLSIFSVLLSFGAVTMFCVMLIAQGQVADPTFPEGSYEACLRCIILKQHPNDVDPLFKLLHNKQENGELICCARTSREFSALLQLMTRRLQNSSILELPSADHYKFTPVSAHVSFKETPLDNKGVDLNKTYPLKLNEISADYSGKTHARQVKLSEDSIKILHSGWYYVYSSVYFRPASEKPCKEFLFKTWGNYIIRVSPQSPANSGCLVKTAHTCCDHCTNDHHSTFTGGVFYFLKGDHIYVESSGGGIIRYEDTASFFGLYMLGTNRPGDQMLTF